MARAESEVVNKEVANIDVSKYIEYAVYDILEHYYLGDNVKFKDRSLVVSAIESHLDKRDGLLKHNYILQLKEGLKFPRLYNNKLTGNGIKGTVIDVKRDFTKLDLHIDEKQEVSTAYWFPQSQFFTAGGSSGFCIMPERGDTLTLHFPSRDEEENYIIGSANMDL